MSTELQRHKAILIFERLESIVPTIKSNFDSSSGRKQPVIQSRGGYDRPMVVTQLMEPLSMTFFLSSKTFFTTRPRNAQAPRARRGGSTAAKFPKWPGDQTRSDNKKSLSWSSSTILINCQLPRIRRTSMSEASAPQKHRVYRDHRFSLIALPLLSSG